MRTHHDTTVKTLCSNRDDDVLSDALQYLATADHKAINVKGMRVFPLLFSLPIEFDNFFECRFLDSVALSSSTRLVTLHVVSRQENTVAGQDFTRLNKRDVSDNDFLQGNELVVFQNITVDAP